MGGQRLEVELPGSDAGRVRACLHVPARSEVHVVLSRREPEHPVGRPALRGGVGEMHPDVGGGGVGRPGQPHPELPEGRIPALELNAKAGWITSLPSRFLGTERTIADRLVPADPAPASKVVGSQLVELAAPRQLPFPVRAVAALARPPAEDVVIVLEDGFAVRLPIPR